MTSDTVLGPVHTPPAVATASQTPTTKSEDSSHSAAEAQ